MDNKNVYLDLAGRQKSIMIGLDHANKEMSISLSPGRGSGYARALFDTTEGWSLKPTYIPDEGLIIVYADQDTIIREGQTIDVPGIKIGDGKAYLIDLPFVGDGWKATLEDHINDTDKHVNPGERDFWNLKLNCEYSGETLVLNRS